MKNTAPLDELVAEKILEWKKEDDCWVRPRKNDRVDLPEFSTNVTAAWEIADAICDQGYRLRIEGKKFWTATFYKSIAHTLETKALPATGGSPAEAICLAALSVLGISPPK